MLQVLLTSFCLSISSPTYAAFLTFGCISFAMCLADICFFNADGSATTRRTMAGKD